MIGPRRMAAALAACALAAIPTSAGAAVAPPGFWGVVPVTAPDSAQLSRIKQGGVRSIRAPLNWSQVERAPGVFDWSSFDAVVLPAARYDIQVLPFLLSSPRWVAPSGSILPVDTSGQQEAWASFLGAAVRRYGPGGELWLEHRELRPQPIATWQIWNEPNHPAFASPPVPARYATLLNLSRLAIKRVDPRARILLAGLYATMSDPPGVYRATAFLARLFVLGTWKGLRGVAVHSYPSSYLDLASIVASVRRVMRRHGASRIPLWITELGWSSRPFSEPLGAGPIGQAQKLYEAFGLFSANRLSWRIAGVYWFSLTDSESPYACDFCTGTGLFTADFRAKPAWRAFVSFSREQRRRAGQR
jgi:polysaccharide biosynthesis protein PslG